MAVKNKTGNREISTSRIPAYKNPKLAVSARVSNLTFKDDNRRESCSADGIMERWPG